MTLTDGPRIVLVAPPQSRRVRAYQTTLAELGLPPARVVAYTELLSGTTHLAEQLHPGDVLRYESPGEDWPTERALLELGRGQPDEAGTFLRLDALPTEADVGCLWSSRQWFLGFRAALKVLDEQRRQAAPHRLMNASADILTMYDKAATTARLSAAGLKVPPNQRVLDDPDELLRAAQARVFVKLAHGSGAAGAVALHVLRGRVSAQTTVQMEGGRLYNSRRVRKLGTVAEVRALLAALTEQRAIVEDWLPKAQDSGRSFDLRIVVIGGRAAQVLVRSSRGPFTNLHLGNERGDWDAVRGWLGERWPQVRDSAQQAAACFPKALYCGVDMLILPSQEHAVLEVNAFGDYHRGVLVDGLDTYGTELRALELLP
ncbi:STM4014 family protein [Deinococcus sp. KNUC1210]|uniref:STM4014 family protein n=1 Tax=Deinococcus sp. KNUC1210 TaxID=2917691 RepID=UPI001EF13456|nr:STM4014 family protein [Deinococcus sp. KNUC1210]ULH16177.1 STM4014 family protein [Deinococcus sp. KNUC1210]